VKKILLLILCIAPLFVFSEEDWNWWNVRHNWHTGMPGWRSLMHITPGYLGPNALPVPDVKKGVVLPGTKLELGLSSHFMKGDPTQDFSARYYRSFADNKIAIELYAVILEHYSMSDSIRDERISRDFDGKGFADGDIYFSTLIQLVKDRKFPDTMLRMAGRTASGSNLKGARNSDSPGYFFDLSFSKSYTGKDEKLTLMPFASAGFYSWQTNDELNLQNDAYMYAIGGDVKWSKWSVSNSLSGYSGYKHERDRPMVYTFDLNHSFKNQTIRLQYLYGIRDWKYQTIKLSMIFNLKK
jgi:hypothetical protein